jgi:6-phospho-3-hexuloisomerase
MAVKDAMKEIATHVLKSLEEINDIEIEKLVELIQNSNRVFVMGAGRSGLVARAFAMRLVQLGLQSYVVGETTTPSMAEDDLLVLVSGSGTTSSIINAAETAKSIGATVLTITSYPVSYLGGVSDYTLKIKGRTKKDSSIETDHLKHQIEGFHSTLTPLGTLFEDTVMVFLDGIIARLMLVLGKKEHDLRKRHASLE